MVRALVTGGSGFIGSHLLKRLESEGYETCNVDVKDSVNPVDVVDFARLRLVFCEFKPDVVVHLAALASVPLCEKDPFLAFETNAVGTGNVVRCAFEMGARVVFASSAAVYGSPEVVPCSEDSPLKPVNCYGRTKVSAEFLVRSLVPDDFVVFRIFNCYGPRCDRSYVVPDIIRRLQGGNGGMVKVLGTGEEGRDFVFIDDVLDAFVSAVESGVSGVFNLGTGRITRIRNLVKLIAEVMGQDDVEFVFEGKTRVGDFLVNQAEVSKLKRELGVCPKVSLKEGLYLTVNGTVTDR